MTSILTRKQKSLKMVSVLVTVIGAALLVFMIT